MAAESDANVQSGKAKFYEKCGLDVNPVDVMLPPASAVTTSVSEMIIVGDEREHKDDGGQEYAVVNGGLIRVNQLKVLILSRMKEEVFMGWRNLGLTMGKVGSKSNDAVEDDCSESRIETDAVDAMESGVHDEIVDSTIEKFCRDHTNGIESRTDTDTGIDIVNGIESGVNDDVADSKIENGCRNDSDVGESRMETVTDDEMGTVVNVDVVDSEIQNGCHIDNEESRMETVTVDEMGTVANVEVVDSEIPNGCVEHNDGREYSAFDHEVVNFVIENNTCNDPLGNETDCGTSDLVNKTKVGCSENIDISAIRSDVVEVEHKELDVDDNGDLFIVDDESSRSLLADNNGSSLHSVVSENGDLGKDDVVEEKREVLVIETEHETVDSESKELEGVKELQPPDLEYEEAA
ncbi:hypothetical protein Dimus_030713 [Dionaea muscipula]